MAHPRVEQLRFARSEWLRGLDSVSEEDGVRRILPMNSMSWMVGHLAWHERLIWLERGQGTLGVEPAVDGVAMACPRRRRRSRRCGTHGGASRPVPTRSSTS